ncbi:hypothetical protein QEZ54_35450 [Catellatospora sp. KI3]|uniref:hypothetical protein n=1 Tax=Catellatospora sp. KI3 TaxID=3041620 RepID=UPI00248242EE|nr:hypothetical protein [Catellatospora sp. KI3]MDI1466287.1 hypothetical protein [Catellatospora sp. KI3]
MAQDIRKLGAPKRVHPALQWIARLSPEDYDALLRELSSASAGPEEIEARIFERFPTSRLTNEVIEVCLNLKRLSIDNDWTPRMVAEQIASLSELELNNGDRESLRRRLEAILGQPALGLVTKTTTLTSDYQYVLRSAAVLVDMRPVFADGSTALEGALIAHTLKIAYAHTDGDLELYVSLSSDDLDDLHQAIIEAKEKEQELRRFLTQADLPILESA